MHETNYLRTIQGQQSQIHHLKDQLNRGSHFSSPPLLNPGNTHSMHPLPHNNPASYMGGHIKGHMGSHTDDRGSGNIGSQSGGTQINFEQKYMKALKQISAILKANNQFKQQFIKLKDERQYGQNTNEKIHKQEFNKAFDNWIKQKNQLITDRENLELDNEKLRYTVAELEENIHKITIQKNIIAQEKQSLRIMSPVSVKDRSGRDADIKRNMDNYEEHHATLNKTITKLEENNRVLENKLYDYQSDFTNRLNQQEIDAQQSKSQMKEQYEQQIAEFRRQLSKLKVVNNELTIKVKSHSEEQKVVEGQNQYQKQLIQTLREVKGQMEPMRSHIAEIQEKNQFQRQQLQRDKTSLQIKVIEYQSEIQRLKGIQKLHESKQVRDSDKNRKLEQAERSIKKLEEENRMIGGRLIVLESKQVALRNRNGDQLEERVLQFQNRVQMLLSDKQTIVNMKNVGIHQLIALKAYILELDAKLKQVVNQNEYAVKKYKTYKQKCAHLIKQLKQHDIAINALKGKLQGYDRLVVKLQGQFERAISINDSEIKTLNMKVTQQSAISIQVYKKRYDSLAEKLSLQQKYSQQQLETLRLSYETQIVQLNIRLQELNSIKQTIGLYKTKNQELSIKLTQKQNQLLENKINKLPTSNITQSKGPSKEAIQKLNQTISSKQTTIMNLQNQVRKIQSQWRTKYTQLQQMTSSTIAKKTNIQQEKQNQIQRLEQQIKNYRKKINDLQAQVFKLGNNSNQGKGDIQYKQYQSIANKKSELQVDLQQIRSKYESEMIKTSKLSKQLAEQKKNNQQLQAEINKLRFQMQNVQKQFQMQINSKDSEIRRLKSRNESQLMSQKPDNSEIFKISSLKMQLETMETQHQYLQKEKDRYYNKTLELERHILQLNDDLERTKLELTRVKNSSNEQLLTFNHERQLDTQKQDYTIRMLKQKLKTVQLQLNQQQEQNRQLKQQSHKQKQKLVNQLNYKEDEYNRIMREFNKLRSEFNTTQDNHLNVGNQFEFQIARLLAQISSYKDESQSNSQRIDRYENQIRKYQDRESQYQDTISNLQIKIAAVTRTGQSQKQNLQDQIQDLQSKMVKFQQDFKFYQDHELQNEQAFQKKQNYIEQLSLKIREHQQKQTELEGQIYSKSGEITKLRSEITFIKNQLELSQESVSSKQQQISRITNQLMQIRNKIMELQFEAGGKDTIISKLNSEASHLKNQIATLEIQLDDANKDAIKWKSQHNWHEQQSSTVRIQLQQKQLTISRLQTDIRSKSDYIRQLAEQIQNKDLRLSDLQNQSIRLRSQSADHESELMDKNGQISRLNFQINSLKSRYNQLQQSFDQREIQWQGMNRQIMTIRTNLEQYQQQIIIKQSAIQRYKKDVKQLNQEIQILNSEIFNKSKQINRLNQQIFRIKMENDQNTSTNMFKMQSDLHQLKVKVTSLEDQLERKQFELNKAEIEARNYRANLKVNKYSDEEYDMLQAQYYQLQSSLNTKNRQINQYQSQLMQLKSKIQFQSRIEKDLKKQHQQDHDYLENQIQAIMARERKLKVQLETMQNDMMYQNTSKSDYEKQQLGMNLYQNQIDRLNQIVEELTEEIDGLKIRLTDMTNQQERIVQNLTVMTLTFAEVEALRLRMKSKQNQISEVRKSLIQYASSSNQDISIHSRKLLEYHLNEEKKQLKFDSYDNVESRQLYQQILKHNQMNRDAMFETQYPSDSGVYDTNNKITHKTETFYHTDDTSQQKKGGQELVVEIRDNNQASNLHNVQMNNQHEGPAFNNSQQSQDGNHIFGARTANSYEVQYGRREQGEHEREGESEREGDSEREEESEREEQSDNVQNSDILNSESQDSNKFQQLVREEQHSDSNQKTAQQSMQGNQQTQPIVHRLNNNQQNQLNMSYNRPGQVNISFKGSTPDSSIKPTSFQPNISNSAGSFHIPNQHIKPQSPGMPIINNMPTYQQRSNVSHHNQAPQIIFQAQNQSYPQSHPQSRPQHSQPQLQPQLQSQQQGQIRGGRSGVNFGPGLPQQQQHGGFYAR